MVVEAVAEDSAVKARPARAVWAGCWPTDALLATTTSSLSIAELARASGRPDRFCGLHVFNPVERMELVELAFPSDAGARTPARAFTDLCEKLGKTAVEVPDVPGFVVNRLLFPYLFEAVAWPTSTDLEPEAVDACMKLGAGHPMGPLGAARLRGPGRGGGDRRVNRRRRARAGSPTWSSRGTWAASAARALYYE